MGIIMVTIMTDHKAFIRLQTWLSPAFPTGAFSYSHGLEAAIASEFVSSKSDLQAWLSEILEKGSGWNDAVLLAHSWRVSSSPEDLLTVAELAEALSFSSTRHLETMAQGGAFLKAVETWCNPGLPAECPLPIAVGAVAGRTGIDLETTLSGYLHAFVSNQIQAALRLMRLGQIGGVEILANLEETILDTAARASASSLDDLGSVTVLADIAALSHETLDSRIFRS